MIRHGDLTMVWPVQYPGLANNLQPIMIARTA